MYMSECMNRKAGKVFRKLFSLLVLVLMILSATAVGGAETAANSAGTTAGGAGTTTGVAEKPAVKNGWYKEKGHTYYYKAGKKLTGWRKIKGKTYYLSKKNGLLKNTIAGSKKSGYWYVDKKGVRVTDPVMKLAVAFVMKNGGTSKSSRQRLVNCFKALCRYPYVRYYGDNPSSGRICGYATDMLKKKGGNCYRYGSAFAYLARALGYEARVATGATTAHRYYNLSPHGWCEVKIGKDWCVVDCSMARHNPQENLCLVPRSKFPFKLRCNNIFSMKIVKGKIKWTGQKVSWNNLNSRYLRLR